MLQPGGRWINLGPLLWHWADADTYLPGEHPSLELSLADVERVARRVGFRLSACQLVPCRYMADARGMLSQEYRCAMWTAEKPEAEAEVEAEAAGGAGGGGEGRGVAAAAGSGPGGAAGSGASGNGAREG